MVSRSDLVIGGVYEVRARNFSVGIWDGEHFVGRRSKFGDTYLDREILGWSIPEDGVVRRLGQFIVPVPPEKGPMMPAMDQLRRLALAWLDVCAELYNSRWRLEDELMRVAKLGVEWPEGLASTPTFEDYTNSILITEAVIERARSIRAADPTVPVPESTKRARQELKDEGIIE